MIETTAPVLAALYLRGAPRPFALKRSGWPAIVRALRESACPLDDASAVLRGAGFWAEALALDQPGLLDWADRCWRRGQVLTAEDEAYPWRSGGQPAFWKRGDVPRKPCTAIVGSRHLDRADQAFATASAKESVRLGFAVISGGAAGADTAALTAAGSPNTIALLPYGLDLQTRRKSGCLLSLCAPDEEFSTATAMERNALIYSAGEAAIVVRARFKQGGTWHGAVDALRLKRTRILVQEDAESAAHCALVALGAIPFKEPRLLEALLASPSAQPRLVV